MIKLSDERKVPQEVQQLEKLDQQTSKLSNELETLDEKINRLIEQKKEKERTLKAKARKKDTQNKIIIGGDLQKMFKTQDRDEILKNVRTMYSIYALLNSNGIHTIEDLKRILPGGENFER